MFFESVLRGLNHWWRYLLTILGVILAYALGQLPFTGVIFKRMSELGYSQEEMNEAINSMDFEPLGIDPTWSMFLLLLSFVAGFFMLWFLMHQLHKRSFKTLITPLERINWSKVFFGFSFWMGITIALEVVSYILDPGNYTFYFDLKSYLLVLLLALLILPIQTSFEELLFRGYLMQGLGLLAGNRWVPLLLTSIGFGMLHMFNPEIEKFGFSLMMTYYIGVGLFLGIITLMDDGLELALGIHAATNIYGVLFVNFDGSALQTPALFRVSELNSELMLIMTIVMSLLFIFIASRKYGWTDWSRLYGKLTLRTRLHEVADKVDNTDQLDTTEIFDQEI